MSIIYGSKHKRKKYLNEVCYWTRMRAGDPICKYCWNHFCEGYKVAMSNEAMLKAMMPMKEKMEKTKNEDKNPKQILIDWVAGVRSSAEEAKHYLKSDTMITGFDYEKKQLIDEATDCIANILGQCKAMEVVLNNSD